MEELARRLEALPYADQADLAQYLIGWASTIHEDDYVLGSEVHNRLRLAVECAEFNLIIRKEMA